MIDVFKEKGKLTLSVGEGYLSAYEISVLKPGDIVMTSKLAGEGYSVFFNNQYLLTGEVVVISNSFGFRVTSFVPPKTGGNLTTSIDHAVEMLPFTVRLGEIDVSLSELNGVGPGTIVNLDTAYSESEDAELLLAGIPIARGKVGVTYENMHLRISEVYAGNTGIQISEVRSSGNLLEKDFSTQYCKNYNFKRPDKVSRNAIDRIKGIHDLFAQNLRMKYGFIAEYELVVDQMTFGEFLSHLVGASYRYLLVQLLPWPRHIQAEHEIGKLMPSIPVEFYVEPENAKYPASEKDREYIEKMTSSTEYAYLNGVFILVKNTSPLVELAIDSEKQEFLLAALRGSWKNFADMNFQLSKTTEDPEDIKVISENEMIIVGTIQDAKSKEVLLNAIYPYITLEPYMGILN